ncbi:MAG: hypothetical protein DI611_04485 [Brachybacterium faecium]|nr:MAG: hypothetical protein DI611_04485 [Brachybacterium faecium]
MRRTTRGRRRIRLREPMRHKPPSRLRPPPPNASAPSGSHWPAYAWRSPSASVSVPCAGTITRSGGVLVAVLVLSYPGDRRALNVRALSRILGTLIGVLVFAPIAGLHLGSAGFVVALCVLLWFVARWTTRNYLIGSVLITVLALMMTVPLTANETPLQLTADRFVDTLIAGAIAMIVLQIVRTRQSRPKDAGSTGR